MDRHLIPRFLPENYRLAAEQPASPLGAMLAAMEALHGPAEQVIETLDAYVSPYRAPDPFVLLQASWLGLDRYFDWSGGRPGMGTPRYRAGIRQLRLLTAEAAELDRERGTHDALVRFLELATGITGFAIADGAADGTSRPFHFTVSAPAAAAALASLVERIVEGERPAHATYEIVFLPPPTAPEKSAP
jgi:phage tail-like protein